jgi:hypothetical protein
VAVDRSGNVFAAGFTFGTGRFGFGAGEIVQNSTPTFHILLVKYNSSGTPQWARTIVSGANQSQFNSVAVDSLGNIYAAGQIVGIEEYGFGSGVAVKASSTGYHVVLVKYDPLGSPQWAQTVTSSPLASMFYSVAVDRSNKIYVAGMIAHTGEFDFGSGVTATGSNPNSGNAVVVKYDPAGAAQWAQTVSSAAHHSEFRSVTVDSLGDIYAVGIIFGRDNYGFGAGVNTAGSFTGGNNVVLVKYNTSGVAQWAQTVASGSSISAYKSVTVDSSGTVYAVGTIHTSGNYVFGTGVAVSGCSSGSDNAVIVEYK